MQGYGLTTFANLPYVFCLGDVANREVEGFDVAFLGAGFDTVGFFLSLSLSLDTSFFCGLVVWGLGWEGGDGETGMVGGLGIW